MRSCRLFVFTFLILLTVFIPAVLAQDGSSAFASGVVFEDSNLNGVRDAGERGIPDVCVSNGRDIVKTKGDGSYRLPITDDTIIFVIKPSGFMTPTDSNNLPKFFYIHKPKGSPKLKYAGVLPTGPLPESVDFALYKHREPYNFQAVFFGDTQVRNRKEVAYLAHDIIEGLIGKEFSFGCTLGDIVFDDLSVYDAILPTVAQMGVTWYNVKGNHDSNYDGAPNQRLTDETFERVFGPSYYSFNYGRVHFIVLNNVYWGDGGGYKGKLDEDQIEFLKNDMRFVPSGYLVVVLTHIPFDEIENKQDVYRILESRRQVLAIAGHTHTQEHRFIGASGGWKGDNPLHVFIDGAACGCWWGGEPDELGIPHATMSDGVPNGYAIVNFDGNKYSITFVPARRPLDYQMDISAPDDVQISEVPKTTITANIFNGSSRSKVEMNVDGGEWISMKQSGSHIWQAVLPSGIETGTHTINVRTTDMFGKVYTGRRIFRVIP